VLREEVGGAAWGVGVVGGGVLGGRGRRVGRGRGDGESLPGLKGVGGVVVRWGGGELVVNHRVTGGGDLSPCRVHRWPNRAICNSQVPQEVVDGSGVQQRVAQRRRRPQQACGSAAARRQRLQSSRAERAAARPAAPHGADAVSLLGSHGPVRGDPHVAWRAWWPFVAWRTPSSLGPSLLNRSKTGLYTASTSFLEPNYSRWAGGSSLEKGRDGSWRAFCSVQANHQRLRCCCRLRLARLHSAVEGVYNQPRLQQLARRHARRLGGISTPRIITKPVHRGRPAKPSQGGHEVAAPRPRLLL